MGRIVCGVGAVLIALSGVAEAQEVANLDQETSVELTASETNGASEDAAPRVSMQFEDASLRDILKSFSKQTGINLIATDEVKDRTVTMYLEDVTLLDALDQILAAANLSYERRPDSQIYLVKARQPRDELADSMVTKVFRLRYASVSTTKLAKDGALAGGGLDSIVKDLLSEHGTMVVDGRTNSLVLTDLPERFPKIESALAALDVKTPQVMIEAEVLETTLKKARQLGLKWGTSGAVGSFTPSGASRTTRFPFGWIGDSTNPTAVQSTSHFGVNTLSFTSFAAAMEALEKDTDTKILARPKILTMDNESAKIELTSDQAVGFTKTTGESSGTTTVTPERMKTGVALTVTPQVNEGGFVTMYVEPSVTKTETAKVTPPSGQGDVVDPKTRSAKAIVRIPEGETLVLGGLIDRSDEIVVQAVPGLSHIPFLGQAFKHTKVDNTASELIVFITPRIIAESGTQVASAGSIGGVPAEAMRPPASRQDAMEDALNRLVN